MIKKIIGKLRRQPKSVRDGIAFWFTCVFVFVVCSVWLFNVPSRFADMVVVSDADSGPVKSFFNQLNDQVATVKDAFPDADEASSSAALGNDSLDALVNRFKERATSSVASDFSVQASSSEDTATTSTSTQTTLQENSETPAPVQREARIKTTSSTTASTSPGR